MIVAATAMSFAVASSAFIVRARMHAGCPAHRAAVTAPAPAATPTWREQLPCAGDCDMVQTPDFAGDDAMVVIPTVEVYGDAPADLRDLGAIEIEVE